MKMQSLSRVLLATVCAVCCGGSPCHAQCCLTDLFAGCGTCCRKPPMVAVAPVAAPLVAPVGAPVAAPVAAVAPPVMVPVQQTSYVPETTYRTQMQSVPVTCYKRSCEIDPCTGCPVECMQPVTQYVQQAVSVPVTQYRAVTTTRYVQMQAGGVAAPGGVPAAPAAVVAPAASPFAAAIQTTPQAWGAAGADVPQQLVPAQPGAGAPALPAGSYGQPAVPYQPPTYQQPITPQGGFAAPAVAQPNPLAPTPPPSLAPAPSLRPIPELPRTVPAAGAGSAPYSAAAPASPPASPPVSAPASPPVSAPAHDPANPAAAGAAPGPQGMPTVPGTGPTSATGAFPRLLAPTSHTTSWQPAGPRLDQAGSRPWPQVALPPAVQAQARGRSVPGYPTAVLPVRLTQ